MEGYGIIGRFKEKGCASCDQIHRILGFANTNHKNTNNGDDTTPTSRCIPGALPIKTILHESNSTVYFVVKLSVLFHLVLEVFCN